MKVSLVLCSAALALAATAVAARPANNVSHARHPNLAAAQRLTNQAYNRVIDAQKANEFDLGGHAAKAKALLEEANNELKAAALTSNAHHR
jgi:hypothetical protein